MSGINPTAHLIPTAKGRNRAIHVPGHRIISSAYYSAPRSFPYWGARLMLKAPLFPTFISS